MYSVCICSWWWDVHTCIYFVSSVVFVDFLIKSSFQKKYNSYPSIRLRLSGHQLCAKNIAVSLPLETTDHTGQIRSTG